MENNENEKIEVVDPIINDDQEVEIDIINAKREILRDIYGNPLMLVFAILVAILAICYLVNYKIIWIVLLGFTFWGVISIYSIRKKETETPTKGLKILKPILSIILVLSAISTAVFLLLSLGAIIFYLVNWDTVSEIQIFKQLYLHYIYPLVLVTIPVNFGLLLNSITGLLTIKEIRNNWEKGEFKSKKMLSLGITFCVSAVIGIITTILVMVFKDTLILKLNEALSDLLYRGLELSETSDVIVEYIENLNLNSTLNTPIFFNWLYTLTYIFSGVAFIITSNKLKKVTTMNN